MAASRSSNNWYVITGGPSSGKTTLLAELEKLGYTTIPEAARLVIDEALAQGKTLAQIRSDEKKFQQEVLERKVALENEHPPALLTFLDRGMHDTIAYHRLYGFELAATTVNLMENANYKKVFILEPLDLFEKDYARTETRQMSKKLHYLLQATYREYGMQLVSVPALPLRERAQFVLRHVG